MRKAARRWMAALLVGAGVAGCGGGGGSDGSAQPPPGGGPKTGYTLGGTVTGLAAGQSVTLSENGSMLTVSANGAFAFGTRYATGSSYSVQAATGATDRVCRVSNGQGSFAAADVASVAVDCSGGLSWVPNGGVASVALAPGGKLLYFSGSFDRVGPFTGNWVRLDPATGQAAAVPATPFAAPVVKAIPDGQGGAYVAFGSLATLLGTREPQLMRVDSAGRVDTRFAPVTLGAGALLLVGDTLYAAGSLYQPPSPYWLYGLHRIDATTGQVRSSITADEGISALAVDAGVLYVGGRFTRIGDVPRTALAAIDIAGGQVLPWDPSPAAERYSVPQVLALQVAGGRLHAGGLFNRIAGQPAESLVAFDLPQRTLSAWRPATTGLIQAIAVQDDQVFVGGQISRAGGATRNALAVIDRVSGLATAWDAGIQGLGASVNSLVIESDRVLVAGYFNMAAGARRGGLAAFARSGGALLDFAAGQVSHGVDHIVSSGGILWTGGSFQVFGGVERPAGLAALNTATGQATAWNPAAHPGPDAIRSAGELHVTRSLVIAANARGVDDARLLVAALDPVTGAPVKRVPAAGFYDLVDQVAADSRGVYIAGRFDTVDGTLRSGVARLDPDTMAVQPWSPPFAGSATAVEAAGGRVFVASDRGKLLQFDADTSAPIAWPVTLRYDANATYFGAQGLAFVDGVVYVQGVFDGVNGSSRWGMAAVDAQTGAVLPWLEGWAASYKQLRRVGGDLYAVNPSKSVAWPGIDTSELVKIDKVTGQVASRGATYGGSIRDYTADDNGFYIGGDLFTSPGYRPNLVVGAR